MTFRERRVPASFRGVGFKVDATTGTKARRVGVKKFAGRDGSENEDHGRDPGEFEVVAFLYGDDYDLARDELEEALAEEGPGALVLPTRGDLWVRVIRGPITTELKDKQGYCSLRFSVVIEDRRAGSLRVTEDSRASLISASHTLRTAAGRDLEGSLDTRFLPAAYLMKASAAVRAFTGKLRTIQTAAQGLLSPVNALTTSIADLESTANTVLATPSLFVTTGVNLILTIFAMGDIITANVDRATGLPRVVASTFDRARFARMTDRAASAFHGLGEPLTSNLSALSQRDADNAAAVYRFQRAAALSAAAEVYASADFDSATLALATLQRTLEEIDALTRFDASDALYRALMELRAKLTRHMLETAARLPETLIYAPPIPTPALVLAWELYGDARMESDIVQRNVIPHPLFVAGDVEVLAP